LVHTLRLGPLSRRPPFCSPPIFSFFFTDPATTDISTLSLHDALPISGFGTNSCPYPAGGGAASALPYCARNAGSASAPAAPLRWLALGAAIAAGLAIPRSPPVRGDCQPVRVVLRSRGAPGARSRAPLPASAGGRHGP